MQIDTEGLETESVGPGKEQQNVYYKTGEITNDLPQHSALSRGSVDVYYDL